MRTYSITLTPMEGGPPLVREVEAENRVDAFRNEEIMALMRDHNVSEWRRVVSPQDLMFLLSQARHFNNQTVLDSNKLAVWHREIDEVLRGTTLDDPAERYDSPAKVEQRKFVDSLFRIK